jgi:dephospho-CoA kinase
VHIIGLIGGVASGKSTVADALARRGAVVFHGDELGHLVLDEPEVREALVRRWGAGILGPDGRIARQAVAEIVFAPTDQGAAERAALEEIVHPGIRRRMEAGFRQLPDASIPAVVIDAAVLLEAGWSSLCTAIVLVDCPREIRRGRALARGWSEEEFARREAAQMPIEEKRRRATHVIDSSGSLEALKAEVDRFWAVLEG